MADYCKQERFRCSCFLEKLVLSRHSMHAPGELIRLREDWHIAAYCIIAPLIVAY